MPLICVSELGQYWLRWWLVAYSAPSHYLNQCWLIVNCTLKNKLQWNLNQNTKLCFTKMHLKISSAKWWPFYPGGRWVHRNILFTILLSGSRPQVTVVAVDLQRWNNVSYQFTQSDDIDNLFCIKFPIKQAFSSSDNIIRYMIYFDFLWLWLIMKPGIKKYWT